MQIDKVINKNIKLFKISFFIILLFVIVTFVLFNFNKTNKKEDISLTCSDGCSLKELYPLTFDNKNLAKTKVITLKNNSKKAKEVTFYSVISGIDSSLIYYIVNDSEPVLLSDNDILYKGTLKSNEEKNLNIKMWFDKNRVNSNIKNDGSIKFEVK